MKNSDELIDRVLTGLRDTQVDAGMEGRILQRMRIQASSASTSRLWSTNWGVRSGAAAAMLLAVGLFGLAVHRDSPARDSAAQSKRPIPLEPLSSVTESVIAEHAQTLRIAPIKPSAGRKRALRAEVPAEVPADSDAIALRETVAPSQPAPEMPLTAQEKLLRRIVHGGNPVELAELDPVVRARRDAEDEAEFHRFFDQRRMEIRNEIEVQRKP